MATRVLEARELRPRAAIVSKLVAAGTKMAQVIASFFAFPFLKWVQMHNYNGVMQVVSALGSAAVARLRQTFAALSRTTREQLEHLRSLVESGQNFRNLRSAQDEAIHAGRPCMPYFALWLTDLVMIDESSHALVSGLVNVAHLRSLSRVLDLLVSSQRVRSVVPLGFLCFSQVVLQICDCGAAGGGGLYCAGLDRVLRRGGPLPDVSPVRAARHLTTAECKFCDLYKSSFFLISQLHTGLERGKVVARKREHLGGLGGNAVAHHSAHLAPRLELHDPRHCGNVRRETTQDV